MPHQSRLILLVEDDPIMQHVSSRLINIAGHEFRISANGREGLDAALEGSFDLILMDIMMPIMDGVTAAELIIKRLQELAPPIVMVTAYDTPDIRTQCNHIGVFDFITKPLTLDKLNDIIDRLPPSQDDE